ncbi:hypothetical protein B0J13DRAFT_626281 [Dactylonectria estremocensis]|uniref:Uncharacterized protein n=1 Tax=Dactylonectria estremocensis TaxID=1079267 RepID=A0A9P9E7F4_9HYPO|nr:hypothetical protein B0J13DRAFT_626281 [Dactylonectria estremocensis]
MTKPHADLGGNICEPCHASVPGAHLRYAKDRKETASINAYKFNITAYHSQPSPPPVFAPEDQLYLRHRLPLQKPTVARTVRLHFPQLTLVYQRFADQSLARAATMVPGPARERRLRMGVLATRLARRYCGYRVVLSDEFLTSVMRRHADRAKRPSRFWEAVLDEVERTNSSWSLARLWILVFATQSGLIILASSWLLPPAARAAVMAASTLGHGWSVAVLWELMNARYFAAKADEEELHDLMGGL